MTAAASPAYERLSERTRALVRRPSPVHEEMRAQTVVQQPVHLESFSILLEQFSVLLFLLVRLRTLSGSRSGKHAERGRQFAVAELLVRGSVRSPDVLDPLVQQPA